MEKQPSLKKIIGDYCIYPNRPIGKPKQHVGVYMGKYLPENKEVAVKIVSKNNLNFTQEYLEGIQQELKILNHIKSENTVNIIFACQTVNNLYVFMEYCSEGTLEQYLSKQPQNKLSEKEAREFLGDILQAFQDIIAKGVIHRNLNHQNILLCQDQEKNKKTLKICDFGFSKWIDDFENQQLKSFHQNPEFSSPQILAQQSYTTKCDIWSIGSLYYLLLYGKLPYKAPTYIKLLLDIKANPLISFPDAPEISENSKDFIKQCLKVDEKERIAWSKLFQHPLVNEIKQNTTFIIKEIDEELAFIPSKMRQYFQEKQITLLQLLNDNKIKKDTQITEIVLQNILDIFDINLDTIKNNQLQKMISQMNKGNGKNYIAYKEFIQWIIKNDIKSEQQIIHETMTKKVDELINLMGFKKFQMLIFRNQPNLELNEQKSFHVSLLNYQNSDVKYQEDFKKFFSVLQENKKIMDSINWQK